MLSPDKIKQVKNFGVLQKVYLSISIEDDYARSLRVKYLFLGGGKLGD